MSDTPDAIRRLVTDYFDRRTERAIRAWDEFLPAQHATAFTVARSAGFDVLSDIRSAVRQGLLDGVPFEEFRERLEPALKAKGWWGRRVTRDAVSGGVVREQLGSPARLKLIYDANIRSAQAAGEWADAWENREFLPYLEYGLSLSERKRDEHRTWVGTTLPIDDPWWRTHYPPNGWRCKCRVRPRATPRADLPPDRLRRPPLDLQPWRSKSTGESRMVPRGIDPGWDNNPGLTRGRMVGADLARRLDAFPYDARRRTVRRLRRDPAWRYVVENEVGFVYKSPPDGSQTQIGRLRWPVAVLPPELAGMLGGASQTLVLSAADAAKMKSKGMPSSIFLDELDQLLAEYDSADISETNGKLVVVGRIGGKKRKLVIKVTGDNETLLNSVQYARD